MIQHIQHHPFYIQLNPLKKVIEFTFFRYITILYIFLYINMIYIFLFIEINKYFLSNVVYKINNCFEFFIKNLNI
jgi:hypothetical protein